MQASWEAGRDGKWWRSLLQQGGLVALPGRGQARQLAQPGHLSCREGTLCHSSPSIWASSQAAHSSCAFWHHPGRHAVSLHACTGMAHVILGVYGSQVTKFSIAPCCENPWQKQDNPSLSSFVLWMLLLKSIFAILFTQKIGQAEYIPHAHQKLSQKRGSSQHGQRSGIQRKHRKNYMQTYSCFIKTAKKIYYFTLPFPTRDSKNKQVKSGPWQPATILTEQEENCFTKV